MMLDGRSNDMLSGFVRAAIGEAENCQVVALGAAAGEDDLRGAASPQACHRLACALHRRPCLLSMVMDRRGVAEMLPEVALHGLKDLGQHSRGCVIVEVDAAHKVTLLFYALVGRPTLRDM